jgi:hypothetical protein
LASLLAQLEHPLAKLSPEVDAALVADTLT